MKLLIEIILDIHIYIFEKYRVTWYPMACNISEYLQA